MEERAPVEIQLISHRMGALEQRQEKHEKHIDGRLDKIDTKLEVVTTITLIKQGLEDKIDGEAKAIYAALADVKESVQRNWVFTGGIFLFLLGLTKVFS